MTASNDFTLDEYEDLLQLAGSCGYRCCTFDEAEEKRRTGERRLFLRHDIDYGPRFMVAMAEIESALGVTATYCVQRDSPWYRVDAPEHRDAIRAVLDAGHQLGLHFDANGVEADGEVVHRVVDQASHLSEEFATPVHTVSFHMPGRRPIGHIELPGPLVNTYGPRFFSEIVYVSDSNQSWRDIDPREVLTNQHNDELQMLIHPFWWREQPMSLRDKLTALAADLGVRFDEIATSEQWIEIERQEAGS